MRTEEIERYLRQEMLPEERASFEEEMHSNPSLLMDVRLLACIIQKTREVYQEEDQRMKDLFCLAKSQYEESCRKEFEFFKEHPNVAAEYLESGERHYTLCHHIWIKKVLPYLDDNEAETYLADIRSNEGVRSLVWNQMTNSEGTTILNIVRACIEQYGLSYGGMKVYDWVRVVRDYVVSVTECEDIEPYEYFVCEEEVE